jgi:hypothetical protein
LANVMRGNSAARESDLDIGALFLKTYHKKQEIMREVLNQKLRVSTKALIQLL